MKPSFLTVRYCSSLQNSKRRRPLKAVLMICTLLLASCGIPLDESARPIADPPRELGGENEDPEDIPSSGSILFRLYFVDDEQLYAVERRFSSPPTANDVLSALSQNPTELEKLSPKEIDGSGTEIPDLITLLPPQMNPKDGGYIVGEKLQKVRVSPSAELEKVPPQRKTLIFSQIVCTLTQFGNEIESVSIVAEKDGKPEPIFAQDESGTQIQTPTTRSNYDCDNAQILLLPTTLTNTKRALEEDENSK